MAKYTPLSLDKLPTELLLEIVHWVGTDSPVGGKAGVSNLVNLSRVNKTLNVACLTLLFRAVKLRFGDFGWHGKLKDVADHDASLNVKLPGMLGSLRSFALENSTTTPVNDWESRTLRAFSGAATTLSYVASIASRLQKLVVIVPHCRHAAEFPYLTTSAGDLHLPHVRELVVNHASNFLIPYCENVVSLAAVEYESFLSDLNNLTSGVWTPHGGPPRDLAELLRKAQCLSRLRYLELETSCFALLGHTVPLPQVKHLMLKGSFRDLRLMPLVAHELRDSFPNVQKLDIVVVPSINVLTRAYICLFNRDKAKRWALLFFNALPSLTTVMLQCAKRANRHSIHKPELSWKVTKQGDGRVLIRWVTAELSLLSEGHLLWTPSTEGPA